MRTVLLLLLVIVATLRLSYAQEEPLWIESGDSCQSLRVQLEEAQKNANDAGKKLKTLKERNIHLEKEVSELIESVTEKFSGNVCGVGQSHWLTQRALLTRVKRRSVEDCQVTCFSQEQKEVFQVEEVSEDGKWSLYCTCSSVLARYFTLFPRRYIKCSSDNNSKVRVHLFYRKDRVWTGLPAPLLFYALDEVTGTTNLGSLNEESDSRSLEWVNGGPHYDCSRGTQNTPNLLRMVPSEKPLLQVVHKISQSSISKGFTWLQWFKKRNFDAGDMPLVDGMSGSGMPPWAFWNFPEKNDINVFYGYQFYAKDKFTPIAWNQLGVVVSEPNVTIYVNSSEIGAHSSAVPGSVTFGEKLYIGRRTLPGSPELDRVFDGCFGHISLFNKALSKDEVQKIFSLFADNNF